MGTSRSGRLPVSISSAVFIFDEQGRMLFVQQAAEKKGYRWGPPAWGIHAHENPIQNAIREAKEEIGCDIELIDLIGIYTTDKGEDSTGIAFAFRGKISDENKITINKEEIMAWKYFTQTELESLFKEDKIYRPDYNLSILDDLKKGFTFPLESIKQIRTL